MVQQFGANIATRSCGRNPKPIKAIAIVDSGGNLVMLQRLDNAQLSAVRIAEAKARTAVELRREGRNVDRPFIPG